MYFHKSKEQPEEFKHFTIDLSKSIRSSEIDSVRIDLCQSIREKIEGFFLPPIPSLPFNRVFIIIDQSSDVFGSCGYKSPCDIAQSDNVTFPIHRRELPSITAMLTFSNDSSMDWPPYCLEISKLMRAICHFRLFCD